MIEKELKRCFPHLYDNKLIHELTKMGQIVNLPRGKIVLDLGDYIEYIPLVLDGLIKVKRKNIEGKEVFLYYLKKGESCAMTLSSCLRRQQSKIVANVLEDTKILLVPSSRIFFFMKNYTNWSEFVLKTFQDKFDDAVSAIERMSFMNLEEQVQDILNGKCIIYHSKILKLTHQSLANDLSTSRVIVSRILKKMESNGLIRLGHKEIEVYF